MQALHYRPLSAPDKAQWRLFWSCLAVGLQWTSLSMKSSLGVGTEKSVLPVPACIFYFQGDWGPCLLNYFHKESKGDGKKWHEYGSHMFLSHHSWRYTTSDIHFSMYTPLIKLIQGTLPCYSQYVVVNLSRCQICIENQVPALRKSMPCEEGVSILRKVLG